MAGRRQQQQGQGQGQGQGQDVAVSAGRRMWRVVRAVLYVLRRGLPSSGRKLAMDLHLLLHRGKIAGKALGDLLTFHHHGHHSHAASVSFWCRALDPTLAVHEPSRCGRRREVEFSCSNTPSAAAAASGYLHCYNYDAADVARVFEMLNDTDGLFNDDGDQPAAAATTAYYATPSPAQQLWALARSPAPAGKQLRVTDSPFQEVDRRADEFIKRFYEQLRAQKSAASTPDYYGRAPRPVAAGIA